MKRTELDKLKISAKPGVYFFRNKNRQILYVGKAASLTNRISWYFSKQPKDARIAKMLELAANIDWQETLSEIEALILESQLIKKYRPPFNVMLRDDKQYFFVVFTSDQFPRIYLTHQPTGITMAQNQNYNSKFKKLLETKNQKLATSLIGPFTDGAALKTALRLFRRTFPYCTCKQQHNNYCLNYHISKCLGFCCLKQKSSDNQRREYLKNIKAIKGILEGKKSSLIKRLKKEMLAFGNRHEFKKAIGLRDKIEKLEKIFENARILHNADTVNNKTPAEQLKKILDLPLTPNRIEGYDVSNIQGRFATGSMVVFTDNQPDKSQYRKFKIRLGGKPDDIAMLKEILVRRFNHPEWPYPDLVIIDGGRSQFNATRSAILKKIPIIALTKNEKHRGDHIYASNKKTAMPLTKLPAPVRNLILQIDAEAHRFAIGYYRKLHKSTLQK